jgi:hypothetical protein
MKKLKESLRKILKDLKNNFGLDGFSTGRYKPALIPLKRK